MFNKIYNNEIDFLNSLKEIEKATKRFPVLLRKRGTISNEGENVYMALGKYEQKYLCSARCIDTMCERAGISGPALERLSAEELVKIIKLCFSKLSDEKGLLVVINDNACALLSDGYRIIPLDSIFGKVSESLIDIGGRFSQGYSTVDESSVSYIIKNGELQRSYARTLEDSAFENAVPILTVTSSNTGLSSVSLTPKFRIKGRDIIVGKPLKAAHKGEANIKTVEENLKQIFSIFKSAGENLEKLKGIEIEFPVQCFKNIAKKISVSKKFALLAAQDFEDNIPDWRKITAYDIYVGLTEAIFHAEIAGKSKEILNMLTEHIARALFINFSEYDLPSSEW